MANSQRAEEGKTGVEIAGVRKGGRLETRLKASDAHRWSVQSGRDVTEGIHWYGDHDGHGLNGCKAGVRKVFKAMGAWKRCPHNQIVMDGVREE